MTCVLTGHPVVAVVAAAVGHPVAAVVAAQNCLVAVAAAAVVAAAVGDPVALTSPLFFCFCLFIAESPGLQHYNISVCACVRVCVCVKTPPITFSKKQRQPAGHQKRSCFRIDKS